jgi:glycosyltransferase involved in cell wall biosynthesis
MVRNEEEFLPRTVASMAAQTVLPAAWIVVDDGSTDRTGEILAEASARHSWIRVEQGEGRPVRNAAQAVTVGFNRVLPLAREFQPDAVVKLDGDMEFEPDFFRLLIEELKRDPELGIVGARALEPHPDGTWGLVRISRHHVHGATHVFRRRCLEEQGGLTPGWGWDTVTIVRARLHGWTTRSLPNVTFRHLRVTGSASGMRRGFWTRGRAAYRAGYHPLFAALRGVRNMVRKPYVVGGVHFLKGFCSGYGERDSRALSPSEIAAFRREQLKALVGGKSWWR